MALHQPYDPYFRHQPDYVYNDRNAINTLFVSRLPEDVKAREIHNLFRRRPGFDYCQLKYTGRGNQGLVANYLAKSYISVVVAFAIFVNHQSAVAALHALNGVKFDPQTGSVLHIELARTNSTRIRKPGSEGYVVIDNRNKTKGRTQETPSDDGDSESDEPTKSDKEDGDKSDSATAKSGEEVVDHENAGAAKNAEKAADGTKPCSTLFIANLGPNCTEAEMKQVFSQRSGFKVLKLQTRGGMPVAFADFEGVEQATSTMDALQGSSLTSSDRGGMHIEYARSKMRKS